MKHDNSDYEVYWGTILGVMQENSDTLVASLRAILNDIKAKMSLREDECRADGIDYANDDTYRRYKQLYGLIGGVFYCMQGCSGMISGIVLDLLKDIKIDISDEGA